MHVFGIDGPLCEIIEYCIKHMRLHRSISLLILLPFLAAGGFRGMRSGNVRLQLLRNVSHFGATVGWYLALTMLPLVEVFAIEFTTPLWTALLALLFLGERLNLGRIVALVLGIVGILVILRPGVTAVSLGQGGVAISFSDRAPFRPPPLSAGICWRRLAAQCANVVVIDGPRMSGVG